MSHSNLQEEGKLLLIVLNLSECHRVYSRRITNSIVKLFSLFRTLAFSRISQDPLQPRLWSSSAAFDPFKWLLNHRCRIFERQINGLAFFIALFQSTIHSKHCHIHQFTHWWPRKVPTAQVHLDMQLGGAWIRTGDLPITIWPRCTSWATAAHVHR